MTRRSSVAVLLAGAVVLPSAACSDDGSGGDPPAASASATAEVAPTGPTGPAGPQPAPATGTPSVGVSTLPAVQVGRSAALTESVRVSVASVTKTQIEASGPGEVSGPGVTVVVDVRNEGSAAVDLTGFSVTASYGQDVPAPPAGNGTGGLTGSLRPGGAATGSYVFAVPAAASGTVQVQVSSNTAAGVAIFQN